ncbi:MAG: fibrobacter succinogenes major paralogous domain-containing protein [Bacteroidales bacterium]|nr:fibrobacter succinogenes major paralogous domain-containing protein [Bacteroidales bacterium]
MKKGLSFTLLMTLICFLVVNQGCKKATVPELSTVDVTQITLNSAVSGGTIISDGGEEITEKGVCWSKTTGPTIADSKTSDGNGSANFTSNLVGLEEGTPYFVRAYATNSVGTAYGNEVTFSTDQVTGAVLTTTEATSITPTSAVAGGNVTDAGGGTITARGICWSSTVQNPTIADHKTSNGTSTGMFTSNLTGLDNGTVYYYRAYATNSSGTTYGETYHFITPVADIEGNIYQTVKIGTQVWMAENLKVTKYNDDTEIPLVTDNTEWSNMTSAAYCWYNNDEEYFKPLYGALYNFYAASSTSICPTGWHVPTDADFGTLELHLGVPQAEIEIWGWRGTDQGEQLKNTSGWNVDENGTNTSGFSALPGGYRFYGAGTFFQESALGYWWTSTPNSEISGRYRRLDGNNDAINRGNVENQAGKSIRCIKNL